MKTDQPLPNRAHELRASLGQMKKLQYRIAGLDIELCCPYGSALFQFEKYRSAFDRADISISISQKEIDDERTSHPETGTPDITIADERVAVTYDYGCFEPFVALSKLAGSLPDHDTVLMHGSVVAVDGQAYMFAASSGTGKTTRTRLWLDCYPGSRVVNGDKPFIRFLNGEILACGTPWSGKERWNTNVMVPLRAVFLLERGSEDRIEEISLGKAFPELLRHCYRPEDPDAMRKTIGLLRAFEGRVRIYRFRSTPTRESVRLAYETARPK